MGSVVQNPFTYMTSALRWENAQGLFFRTWDTSL